MCSLDDITNYIGTLDDLERMADELDNDVAESKRLLNEIHAKFRAIPSRSTPTDNNLRHEDLSKFLEADEPKLLLPDMCDSVLEIDLDDVITTMKSYAEDLKKSYVALEPTKPLDKSMSKLDLDDYAYGLHQLGMRLANIKLTKKEEINNRNPELEGKLTQLCEDVNNFTQMVQTQTKLTETNKNWSEPQQENTSLQYSNIINKLLAGVNELVYLLQTQKN